MSKTIAGSAQSALNFNTIANGTSYNPVGGCMSPFNNSSEAQCQVPVAIAGTFSRLSVDISRSFANATYTSRKNAAGGNQSVTTAGAGKYIDSTHSDSVVAADLVDIQCTMLANDFQTCAGAAMMFDAGSSSQGQPYCITMGNRYSASSNATGYWPIAGGSNTLVQSATEGGAQVPMPPGTYSYLFAFSATNTMGTNQTFTLRVNGVDGNNTTVFGAGVTGRIVDTTHSDTLNSGDLVSVKSSNADAGAFTFSTMGAFYTQSPGAAGNIFGCVSQGTGLLGLGNDVFSAALGDQISAATSAEGQTQMPNPAPVSLTNLSIKVLAPSTVNVPVTLFTRQNSLNANETVVVPANTGGTFTDVTHVDVLSQGDVIDVRLHNPGGGGTGSYTYISHWTADQTFVQTFGPAHLSLTGSQFFLSTQLGFGAGHFSMSGAPFSAFNVATGGLCCFSIMRNTHADACGNMTNVGPCAVGLILFDEGQIP